MTINERIQLIIDKFFKGNKRKFALHAGLSASVIENIVGKRKGNLSYDVSCAILRSNTFINAEWLMLGIGEMMKEVVSEMSDLVLILLLTHYTYASLSLK